MFSRRYFMTVSVVCRLAGAIVLVAVLPAMAHARDGRYLTWSAKTAAPVQQNAAQTYAPPMPVTSAPVPPSPYGQVGDPYAHVLTWGAKMAGAMADSNAPAPQPVASVEPVRHAPVQQMQATVPAESEPQWQPAPKRAAPPFRPDTRDTVAPTPMGSTLPEAMQTGPIAEPSQDIRYTPPAVAAESQPQPRPVMQPPVAQGPKPLPAVAAAPPAAESSGAYQVPASSPYAARIAAARAAQIKAAQAQADKATTVASAATAKTTKSAKIKMPAAPAMAPTAPAPAPVTAEANDDKPFVPGEHYTDASEAPRLYSLHRDYGLKPDPITVDTNPGGALLDTSRLDAAEAKAAKADADDGDDDTTDNTSDKTATPSDSPAPKTKASS